MQDHRRGAGNPVDEQWYKAGDRSHEDPLLIDGFACIAIKPAEDDEQNVEIIAALLDVSISCLFRRRGMS